MAVRRWILISAVLAALSCATFPEAPPEKTPPEPPPRPAHWAQPIEGKPGLPNLFKVTDTLYRGAQPEDEGFQALKGMGIRTVLNLRSVHSDRKECRKSDLEYVKVSVQAWEAEEDEVIEVLRAVTDPDRQPVFIHCKHGADRTGMMIAVYRIVVQGWTKDDAIEEMTEGGYGFHPVWQNLIEYVEELPVERIRARLRGEPE